MKRSFLVISLFLPSLCLHSQNISQFIFPGTAPDSLISQTCWRFTSKTDSSFQYTQEYKNGKLVSYSYPGFTFTCSYDSSGKLIAEKTVLSNSNGYESVDSFYYDKKGRIISGKIKTNNSKEAQYCRFLYNINGKLDSMVCTLQSMESTTRAAKVRYGDTVVTTEITNPGSENEFKLISKYSSITKKVISQEFISVSSDEIRIYERNDSLQTLTTKIVDKLNVKHEETEVSYQIHDLAKNETKYFNYKGELLYTDKFKNKYK